MFARGPGLGVRFIIYVLLSLALMAIDLRLHALDAVHSALSTLIQPLRAVAGAPWEAVERMGDFFVTHARLERDNRDLRREQLLGAASLRAYRSLEMENARLRALLEARPRLPVRTRQAEVVAVARDPFTRRVWIDAGATHGVSDGRPVMDAAGVVGQVTRAHPLQSEVTLITDKDQMVPAEIERNGLRVVVFGAGNGALEVRFLPVASDVQQGDMIRTSGLDGVYPAGLPVARVAHVERPPGAAFVRVECLPLGGVENHRELLVLLGPAPAARPEGAR
jgi:rod shape-determining protein MreC